MTLPQELFVFLTCSAVILVFHCEADRLPPPTELSYEWLDPFTVNVSWLKPTGLLDNCDIEYEVQSLKDTNPRRTTLTNIKCTCMTEDMDSDGCKYTIRTVSKNPSEDWCAPILRNGSTPVTITTKAPKPQAEVVKDFKCLTYPNEMNCSWIPVNSSLKLKLSYRICGNSEVGKPLKSCDEFYSDEKRGNCNLKGAIYKEDICMCVETEAGRSTFKPSFVLPLRNMSVTKEGDKLKLSWTPPEIGKTCHWIYEVCYGRCSEPMECKNITTQDKHFMVAYDKRCRYEFKSRTMNSIYCTAIRSDFTEVVTYGTNEPPDGTLTVVAIVIPVILSICVILSCYCFRRHRAIICPIIPDPSAIFKEMMMNGNKELKTPPGNLYTPVPEPIEPCKITLVPENSVLQQNS